MASFCRLTLRVCGAPAPRNSRRFSPMPRGGRRMRNEANPRCPGFATIPRPSGEQDRTPSFAELVDWAQRSLPIKNMLTPTDCLATLIEAADLSDQNQLHLVATRQSDAAAENELSFDTKKDIADGFLRLAALPTFALDRLSRYEHLLWRQARQIVFTLESLRRRKRQPSRSTFPFSFRRREPGALSEEFRYTKASLLCMERKAPPLAWGLRSDLQFGITI